MNERESVAAPVRVYEAYLAYSDATRKSDAEFWLGELEHSGAAP